MAVTLCIPPRPGELCAPVRFLLRTDSVVMELTARHRITGVEWDGTERAVAMMVEITDPETARPVDVRIDVVAMGAPCPDPRTQKIGTIVRDGHEYGVEHHGERLIITTNSEGAEDFRVCEAPLAAPERASWRERYPRASGGSPYWTGPRSRALSASRCSWTCSRH